MIAPRAASLAATFVLANATLSAAAWAGPPRPVDGAEQLVVVTTDGFDADSGTLQRFERHKGRWRMVDAPIAVRVGRAWLGWGRGRFPVEGEPPPAGPVKHEGDKRAPAGVFTLGQVTGYTAAAPAGSRMPYRQATPALRCVDDPKSPEYNRLAIAPDGTPPPWSSDEHMRRDDGLYEYTVFVEHNSGAPRPGDGSCIFLHVVADPPRSTVGCTAMALDSLRAMLAFLDPAKHPLLVQMPRESYEKLQARLALPSLPKKK